MKNITTELKEVYDVSPEDEHNVEPRRLLLAIIIIGLVTILVVAVVVPVILSIKMASTSKFYLYIL